MADKLVKNVQSVRNVKFNKDSAGKLVHKMKDSKPKIKNASKSNVNRMGSRLNQTKLGNKLGSKMGNAMSKARSLRSLSPGRKSTGTNASKSDSEALENDDSHDHNVSSNTEATTEPTTPTISSPVSDIEPHQSVLVNKTKSMPVSLNASNDNSVDLMTSDSSMAVRSFGGVPSMQITNKNDDDNNNSSNKPPGLPRPQTATPSGRPGSSIGSRSFATGRYSIRRDSRASGGGYKRLSLISNRQRKAATLRSPFKIVRENAHKYDTFYLRQDHTSLLLFDNLSDFLNNKHKAKHQTIIDSFSYNVTLHTCSEDFSDIPKLFLKGSLPKLHLKLSVSTFSSFFEIADDLIRITKKKLVDTPESNTDDDGGGDADDTDKTTNNEKKTDDEGGTGDASHHTQGRHSRQPTTEELILQDMVIEDNKAKMEEEIAKAGGGGKNKKSPYMNFVTRFEMTTFSLQVIDDDGGNSSKKQPIAMLKCESLVANIKKTEKHIESRFGLKSLFVEDLYQQSGNNFKYLITSNVNSVMPDVDIDDSKELISIDFEQFMGTDITNVKCQLLILQMLLKLFVLNAWLHW